MLENRLKSGYSAISAHEQPPPQSISVAGGRVFYAQTGIVGNQRKDRAVRMTVPVGESFTVTLRDTETVMTRISTRAFHVKSHPRAA